MTTIFIVMAFCLGALVGAVLGWRWGGAMYRRPYSPDVASDMNEESQAVVTARIALRKERIMEAATALGKITNNGVEDLFCIGDRTASTYLNQLTAEGRLERRGAGRGTYYVPRGLPGATETRQ